jgi:hypothetical protein
MIERRRLARVVVNERARLLSPSDAVLSCMIRDLSACGACLEIDANSILSDTFDLVPNHGEAHSCRVRWRSANRVGVAFQE